MSDLGWKVSSQKIPSLWFLVLVSCGGQIAKLETTEEAGFGTYIDDGGDESSTTDGGTVTTTTMDAGTTNPALKCTSAAGCPSGEVCCLTIDAGAFGGPGGPPMMGGGAESSECKATCGGGRGGPGGGGGQQLCATSTECPTREMCRAGRDGLKVCQ